MLAKTIMNNHQRNSNLELYRIIAMLLIVAHHYVVNSGLTLSIAENPLSANSLFYTCFGAWGKTGINCFVLITGYFMCKSSISLRKFLKLLLWVLTYSVLITLIFTICGYHSLGLLKMWFSIIPFREVGSNFTSCFLIFYLLIPFLTILINNISRRHHLLLIAILFFIYVVHGSIPYLSISKNYVSWFCVLFFIASYIRLYPLRHDTDTRFWGWLTALSWGLSIISILFLQWLQVYLNRDVSIGFTYLLISDSNSILALTNGFTSFMLFKNLKIKNSSVINTIAASSFGVLLIHANSGTMRQWLWKDIVDCVGHFSTEYYWLYAISVVIIIYVTCTIIDIIRKKTIEKPLLDIVEKLCLTAWSKITKQN